MEKKLNMDYFRKLAQDIQVCRDAVEIAEEIGRESDRYLEDCPGFYEFLFRAIKDVHPNISYDWNPIVEHFDLQYYQRFENPKLQYANDFILYKIEVLDPSGKIKRKTSFGFPIKHLDLLVWICEKLTDEIGFLKDKSKAHLFASVLCADHIRMIKPEDRRIEINCSNAQFAYSINQLTDLFKIPFYSSLLTDIKIVSRKGDQIDSGYLNKEMSFQKDYSEVFDGWRHAVNRLFKVADQKLKNK